jgi:hypothetical protein
VAQQKLRLVIDTVSKGAANVKKLTRDIQGGFDRGRKAVQRFNEATSRGHRIMSGMTGMVTGLIGAYAGWEAVTGAVRIVQEADSAVFNLKTSVAAANREFGASVGNTSQWESAVQRLRKELVIYSETALRGAVSRTVDMTKRLGLSAEQMKVVIKRSADLGAGKTDLEGSIERVTAALRGEAEASEYLGLTLNENYVKAWYEARGAMQGAWKDLTDIQKAQIRYAVFLEQSDELQGRAAESAKTFGGAMQLIKAEITDAIANNKDLVRAMSDVAESLRENSGEIGAFIGDLVSLGAKLAEITIKWKTWIAALAGTYAVFSIGARLVAMFKGLHAVFVAITGMGFIAFLSSARAAIAALTVSVGRLGLAMRANVAVMAAMAIPSIMKLGSEIEKSIRVWLKARKLAESEREAAQKYKAAKDVQIRASEELQTMTARERKEYNKSLVDGLRYWGGLEAAAVRTGKEYGEYEKHTREIRGALASLRASGVQSFKNVQTAVEAGDEALDEFAEEAKKAYEEATAAAEKHADRIRELEEEIQYIRMDTEDQIRALQRKSMSEEQAWADERKQAEEKISAARKAMAEGDSELAKSLLEDAKTLAAGLATEVTRSVETATGKTKEKVVVSMNEAVKTATGYIKQIGDLRVQVNKQEIAAEEKARAALQKTASSIESMLKRLAQDRESEIKITVPDLEDYERRFKELTKTETKTIKVKTVEAKSTGGPAGFAGGGKIPGWGGGDKIRAWLERGEWVIRKEAVRKYGSGLFAALNNLRLPMPRFATGGLVGGNMAAADLGRVEIAVGGRAYPVFGKRGVVEELKGAIQKERLMKGN